MKRPSFQFYPGDWLNDAALRMVSVGARGLWIEMICLMHQGEPYGHLKVNGKAITEIQITRIVGANLEEIKNWLSELDEAGVMSVNDDGSIYSRRMLRDETLRESRANGGKQGGNPKLMGGYNKEGFVYAMHRSSDSAIKIGISQDPNKRLYKIKAQFPKDEIKVIGKLWVEDMGTYEAQLHKVFQSKKDGEWFSLDASEIENLLNIHLKVKQTPSSSSSSSTSLKNKNNKPQIPYQKIVDLYHEFLPTCPRTEKITTKRKGQIAARWHDELTDLEMWSDYFKYCSSSDFLTGKVPPSNGRRRFVADLEFLTNESNYAKIIERKFHA